MVRENGPLDFFADGLTTAFHGFLEFPARSGLQAYFLRDKALGYGTGPSRV